MSPLDRTCIGSLAHRDIISRLFHARLEFRWGMCSKEGSDADRTAIVMTADAAATMLNEATNARMPEADDKAHVVARMDNDGGAGSQPSAEGLPAPAVSLSGAYRGVPRGPIPGDREPVRLTQFRRPAGASSRFVSDRAVPMSAATIADRQLEGGGASSRWRPVRDQSRWKSAWQRLHRLLMSMRAAAER